jgi:hypothetical protein
LLEQQLEDLGLPVNARHVHGPHHVGVRVVHVGVPRKQRPAGRGTKTHQIVIAANITSCGYEPNPTKSSFQQYHKLWL